MSEPPGTRPVGRRSLHGGRELIAPCNFDPTIVTQAGFATRGRPVRAVTPDSAVVERAMVRGEPGRACPVIPGPGRAVGC